MLLLFQILLVITSLLMLLLVLLHKGKGGGLSDMFGGGVSTNPSSGFNVLEFHQANARLTNSIVEYNLDGTGGQAPAGRLLAAVTGPGVQRAGA